jgi:hypothetical protein
MRCRSLLPLLLPLLAVRAAEAQSSAPPHRSIRIGLSAGFSTSTFNIAHEGGFQHRSAFVPGVEATIPLDAPFSIVPSLPHVRKGAWWLPGPGVAASYEVDYVELPIALRVHLPAVRRVVPFADLGPAVSYRTGCWVDDNGPGRDRQTCSAYDRGPKNRSWIFLTTFDWPIT